MTFDGLGNMLSSEDPGGHTTDYAYNYVEEEFFNAQDWADALSNQEKVFPRQFRRLPF